MQTYSLDLFGGSGDSSNTLEFRETGTPDNQGTYIANVRMGDVIVIDETAGHDSDSNETDNPAVAALFHNITITDAGHDGHFGAPQYATGSNAALNYAADFGTDGPQGGSAAAATSYSLAVGNANSGLFTTDGGHAISLSLDGNIVVGRYDSNGDTTLDSVAFAFTIDPQTGIVSVVQYVALQHPDHSSNDEGVYLNSGSLSAQVTITDGDGDHATQGADISATIRFEDDGPQPFIAATNATLTIDETAGIDTNTNDIGTATIPAVFAGLGTPIEIAQSGGAIVSASGSFGADGQGTSPTAYALLIASGGVDSGLSATDGNKIFLYEENGLVIGRESTGATGDPAGAIAFAISLDSATGVMSVAEYTAIHHPIDTDPNDPVSIINNALQATVTFTDGDGDQATSAPVSVGGHITFLDDGPTVASAPQSLIVNGDFSEGSHWSTPDWWGSSTTDVTGWTIAASPVGPGTVDLERAPDGLYGMHSSTGGYMVDLGSSPGNIQITQSFGTGGLVAGQNYAIEFEAGAPFPETAKLEVLWNGHVIGTIDPSGPGLLTSYNYIVTATGTSGDSLTFREIGTGDAPLGQDQQGHDLQTEGYQGTYLANIKLIPTSVVDEDGLPKGNQDLPTPSEGDAPGLATSVTGVLGINWGADNYDSATADTVSGDHFVQDGGTMSGRSVVFTDAGVDVSGASGLTSKGDAVTLNLTDSDTVLVGTAMHDGVSRVVFEVSLSDDGTGAFKFVLKDALDQAPNGSENDLDLTFHYTATDSDGDSALGTFTVGVDDDMPIVTAAPDAVSLNESGLLGSPSVQAATGFLHINWGADNGDSKHLSFAKDADGHVIGPALSSGGVPLDYIVRAAPDSPGNEQILAYKHGADQSDDGNIVFSITLYTSGNGYYTAALYHPVDGAGQGADTQVLNFTVLATDSDGDTIALDPLQVSIVDGIPHPVIATTDVTLTIDETAGDQNPGSDDFLGAANTPIPAAFASVVSSYGTPIEIAQGNGAVVSSSGSYGPDGQGTTPPAYALLVAAGGADSGLTATDGNKIFLYEEGGLVIGRESTGATGDPSGAIAFAISLDSTTGVMTVAEYTAIHHSDKTDPNDSVSITNGSLQATVTFTDGDNDHVTSAPVSVGGQIHFLDDGPTIIPAPQNLIVNGSFEADTGLTNDQWSIYHHVEGWTAGSDGVPFELQNNASIQPKDGSILVELDSDTGTGSLPADTTNHFNDTGTTNATIQQTITTTQAGQTYELTFWYAPRPGEAADSGDMKVLWNNTEVETIHSTGLTQGEWQQYSVFVVGTGHDTVAFQGAGTADNFGALLDNVSLAPMTAVDEDGLRGSPNDAVTGNHDSQPGDANVPDNDHLNGLLAAGNGDGNEATATGVLNINWGADNYDAADTYSDANGFTQDTTANVALTGAGRSLTFTNNSVGITGGTLSSHGDTISFELSQDGTKLIGTAQHGTDPVRTVIEVTLSDDNTGAFHVILHDALDQSSGNNENDIILSFNYTATDSDGDTALGSFNVLVDDDVPVLTGNVATSGAVNEADMFTSSTVETQTLDFSSTGLSATHLQASGGTGISVVSFGGNSNLEGPDQNPGATTLVFTADSGTTFTLNSIALGLYGANSGSSDIVLKGYDADGNLIATATFTGQDVGGNPAAVITSIFDGSSNPDFGNLQISKLEIIPPSTLAGRVVVDNLDVTETTTTITTTPHAVETIVDLTPLVSVGADSPGTWAVTSFASQPVHFTQGSNVDPATYNGTPITLSSSDGHTITGMAGTDVIFTMTVSTDGHATFDLLKPIDGGTLRSIDFSQFVTVTDSDGDKLTLANGDFVINVNSTDHQPTVSADTISVNEAGLPTGSAHDGSNAHPGTIAINPGDGPSQVTIDGVLVTHVNQTFESQDHLGTLTITSITTAGIGYSYELQTNTSGEDTHDSFNVVVTDADHESQTATLTIDIVDDTPTAHVDLDSTGIGAIATGNVITGDSTVHPDGVDIVGADGAHVSGIVGYSGAVGTEDTSHVFHVDGQYGTLAIDENGEYTYTRNSSATGAGTDTFTYTLTDGDSDPSTSTLTINLDANNQPPELTVTPTSVDVNGHNLANEAGIAAHDTQPAGTSAGDGSNSTQGTFTLTDADGASNIHTVKITGTGGEETLTVALNGTGATVQGQYGTLVIAANPVINGNTVTYSYTYTLTDAFTDSPNVADRNIDLNADAFTLLVADASGATGDATLNIDIKDDIPILGTSDHGIVSDQVSAATLGDLHLAFGADGANTAHALTLAGNTAPSGLTLDGTHAVLYSVSNDGLTLTGYVDSNHNSTFDSATDTTAFTLALDAGTGEYAFTLDTPFTHGINIGGSGTGYGAGPALENPLTLTVGGMVTQIAIVSAFSGHQVSGSSGGWGVDNANFDKNEHMRFDFTNGAVNSPTPDSTFHAAPPEFADFNFSKGGSVTYNVHYVDGSSTGDVTVTENGSLHLGAAGQLISYVDFTAHDGLGKLDLTHISSVVDASQDLSFNVTATDGDGDTALGHIGIHLEGSSALAGTAGVDVFGVGSHSGVETIANFGSNDKIDLSGLLDSIYGGTQDQSSVQVLVDSSNNSNLKVQVADTSHVFHDIAVLSGYNTAGSDVVNVILNEATPQTHTYTA
jgi:T1SS-143 domain-containing protein